LPVPGYLYGKDGNLSKKSIPFKWYSGTTLKLKESMLVDLIANQDNFFFPGISNADDIFCPVSEKYR
jgi:hypothetical protein